MRATWARTVPSSPPARARWRRRRARRVRPVGEIRLVEARGVAGRFAPGGPAPLYNATEADQQWLQGNANAPRAQSEHLLVGQLENLFDVFEEAGWHSGETPGSARDAYDVLGYSTSVAEAEAAVKAANAGACAFGLGGDLSWADEGDLFSPRSPCTRAPPRGTPCSCSRASGGNDRRRSPRVRTGPTPPAHPERVRRASLRGGAVVQGIRGRVRRRGVAGVRCRPTRRIPRRISLTRRRRRGVPSRETGRAVISPRGWGRSRTRA